MRRRTRHPVDPVVWGRRKLLLLLVGAVAAAVVLLVGIGLSVYYTVQPGGSPAASQTRAQRSAGDRREVLAARPMPTAAADDSRPGPLTTNPFGSLSVPTSRRMGAAGVPTGFPRTKQGALAQLIAVDQTALQSASVMGAQDVIASWARLGGPTPESWSGVHAIAEMLSSAQLPSSGEPSLTVSASPQMGLIKGAVGSEYVVACIDFVVTATAATTAKVAAADCQRMVWTPRGAGGGRWVVGSGSEPAQPPSVWPGTETARRAGYLRLSFEG